MQHIFGLFLKAVKEFSLIESGDRIAIGVSGGKDSIVLLECFLRYRKYIDGSVELVVITLNLNFNGQAPNYSKIEQVCKKSGVKYIVKETNIADIVFKLKKENNPCSLCSKMRKGVLNLVAKENGCNKVAFGHHFDDVVETFIMNLFIEGRVGCFSPKTYFERMKLILIRPMVFVKEREIIRVVLKENFVIVKNNCPVDGKTKREETKKFLNQMEKKSHHIKSRIFGALRRTGLNGWEFKK